ncbi:hypothetical protein [Pseudorhodobacter sp.]|uniref:hypothetical protein n=1 Tax=Pseudorhodobacter sp. TaxID=1934400 RepID=UPI002AFF0C1B|nr:hypothetical protein [Pseudorhodobacter sp.]
MQESATIIAHILFRHGAFMNISSVLRTLDTCLEPASKGAYALEWDSEDVMVAQFAQTRVIIVAGHQYAPAAGFALTIAVSPRDLDAIANPVLSSLHRVLIEGLVHDFTGTQATDGVFWQRARAPITTEAVEIIADALAEKLAQLGGTPRPFVADAHSIDTAQFLSPSSPTFQTRPGQPD